MVSIGIPFLNPGPYLDLAVRSVFAQTYPDWELILIDDGSTDGSYERAMAIQDPRVGVFRDSQNKGLPARLNEIVRLANGELVARMDADDAIHPFRLEKQIAFLQANPEVDGVTSGAYLIDTEDKPIALLPGRQPSAREALARGGFLHASLLARKAWFEAHPYSLDYPRAEDRELFVRTFRTSKVHVLPEPLYFYRWFGVPRGQTLRTGYRSERKVMCKYGPSLVGWGPSLHLIILSYGKELVTWFLERTRLEKGFQTRRAFQPLLERDRREALKILKAIRETPVPGWD
ncbi:glycosyltransferase family 2 protein [Limisphaera sp. 4302-co]|uniref:glycosyltransferase family 2 protein n=1 Tax=Limisphaera sp. 4302-co TaxID=3400417 RepID=UPI003C1AEBFA